MDKVMEAVCHGTLKSVSSICNSKWNESICQCAPRSGEGSLGLVFFLYLNLVILGKTIHERKDFMSGTDFNDIVNEWSGEIILETCQIQIMESVKTRMVPFFLLTGT